VDIPKRVKVGGLWYIILTGKETNDEMDIRGVYGRTDYVDLTIKLDTQPAEAKIKQTLVHEISHAINTALPYEDRMSERQVHVIAHGLFQVLTENPEVRKFIFEED